MDSASSRGGKRRPDENITPQLRAAGAIVGIELLDHIIFHRTGYCSFVEDGEG